MTTRSFAETSDAPSPHKRDQASVKRIATEAIVPNRISAPPPIVPQYNKTPIKFMKPGELQAIRDSQCTYLSCLPRDIFHTYLVDRYLDPCAFAVEGFAITQRQVEFRADLLAISGPKDATGWAPSKFLQTHATTSASGEVVMLFYNVRFKDNSMWIGVLDETAAVVWEKIFTGLPPMHDDVPDSVECISNLGENTFTFAVWYTAFADHTNSVLPNGDVFVYQTAMIFAYNDGALSSEPFLFDKHGRSSIVHNGAIVSIPHHFQLRPSWLSPILGRVDLDEYDRRKDISCPSYNFGENVEEVEEISKHAIICDKLVDFCTVRQLTPAWFHANRRKYVGVSQNGTYAVFFNLDCTPIAEPNLLVQKLQHQLVEYWPVPLQTIATYSDLRVSVLIATDWGFAYQLCTIGFGTAPDLQEIFIVKFEKPECVAK